MLENMRYHHMGWTSGVNDMGEASANWHGRGQWADRVRPNKLWLLLWVARGATDWSILRKKLYDESDLTG